MEIQVRTFRERLHIKIQNIHHKNHSKMRCMMLSCQSCISCSCVSTGDLDLKNKIEVMELSDLHHPSCKLNQSRQGSFEDDDIEPDDLDEDMDDDRYVRWYVYQFVYEVHELIHQNRKIPKVSVQIALSKIRSPLHDVSLHHHHHHHPGMGGMGPGVGMRPGGGINQHSLGRGVHGHGHRRESGKITGAI